MIRRLTAAAAVAALVVLAGCSGSGSGSTQSASPIPSVVRSAPASLARFYDQTLAWKSCDKSFQCATLTVPEDYTEPTGKTLAIAVIRKQSTKSHEGSILINPGGPGGSGVTFLSEAASAFGQLNDHYDLVSFDPRGVGLSDPIRCLSSTQLDQFINANPVPTTPAEIAATVVAAKRFANACYARNGSYLEHIGTKDQARDMDVLRATLGDQKLTYYGASYGTYLGAKYAELFPTHIRAMVLDGAVNPAETVPEENIVQAKGFQTDLDDFIAACVKTGKCPLGSTADAAHAEIDALKERVTAKPETGNGRELGPGDFFEGLAGALYSPASWPQLWAALNDAKDGNPAPLLALSDEQVERNPDGSYTNLDESNLAINCIDRPSPRALSAYVANAAAAAVQSPDFGAAIAWGSLPCAYWRVPPVEQAHAVHAPGAPPILVIGTTRDPATPYVWAQALAKQLDSAVLLTFNDDGHTAYFRGNSCVDDAVSDYVHDLVTPKVGTTCG